MCIRDRAGFVRYCPWSRNANASFSYKEVHPLAAAFPPAPSPPQQLLWTTCKHHRNCTISVIFILPYYWDKIKGSTERLHTSLSGDSAVQIFPAVCYACAPVNYFWTDTFCDKSSFSVFLSSGFPCHDRMQCFPRKTGCTSVSGNAACFAKGIWITWNCQNNKEALHKACA